MKKLNLKKIKWENINSIIYIIYELICILHHIKLNGLYINLLWELVLYNVLGFALWYTIKAIRKNEL